MLEIVLLKRHRRGFYKNGGSNADTFWYSLLAGKSGRERLPLTFPPQAYYQTDWDAEGTAEQQRMRRGRGTGGGARKLTNGA